MGGGGLGGQGQTWGGEELGPKWSEELGEGGRKAGQGAGRGRGGGRGGGKRWTRGEERGRGWALGEGGREGWGRGGAGTWGGAGGGVDEPWGGGGAGDGLLGRGRGRPGGDVCGFLEAGALCFGAWAALVSPCVLSLPCPWAPQPSCSHLRELISSGVLSEIKCYKHPLVVEKVGFVRNHAVLLVTT